MGLKRLYTEALNTVVTKTMRRSLDNLCKKASISKGSVVRLAVAEFLDSHNDASGEELAVLRDRAASADFVEVAKEIEKKEMVEVKTA